MSEVTEALDLARAADTKAAGAANLAANADQLMGLAVSQQRTESSLNEHKNQVGGASRRGARGHQGRCRDRQKQAAEIASVKNQLSNTDVGKIAGGVTALLVAIAGAITLAATQLAPVLPSVVQQRYATPSSSRSRRPPDHVGSAGDAVNSLAGILLVLTPDVLSALSHHRTRASLGDVDRASFSRPSPTPSTRRRPRRPLRRHSAQSWMRCNCEPTSWHCRRLRRAGSAARRRFDRVAVTPPETIGPGSTGQAERRKRGGPRAQILLPFDPLLSAAFT